MSYVKTIIGDDICPICYCKIIEKIENINGKFHRFIKCPCGIYNCEVKINFYSNSEVNINNECDHVLS